MYKTLKYYNFIYNNEAYYWNDTGKYMLLLLFNNALAMFHGSKTIKIGHMPNSLCVVPTVTYIMRI